MGSPARTVLITAFVLFAPYPHEADGGFQVLSFPTDSSVADSAGWIRGRTPNRLMKRLSAAEIAALPAHRADARDPRRVQRPANDYDYDEKDPWPSPTYDVLRQSLEPDWPELAAALGPDTSRFSDLEAIARAVARARSGSIPAEQADLVLFAANLWSRTFEYGPGQDSTNVAQFNKLMAPQGVKIVETHYSYCYDGGFLTPLLDRAGGNDPWADWAFLDVMWKGFDDSCGGCGAGHDIFIVTIERGKRFIADHPRSAIAPDVQRMIAEAHETAWSLSLAPSDAEDVDPSRYVAGAAAHRNEAVRNYQEYLRVRPVDPRSPFILDRLRSIRANRDTKFYKYYCYWD